MIAYKVFVVEQGSTNTEYTCGNQGCPHKEHQKIIQATRILRARTRNDRTLQNAGDKALATGTIKACENGWHAAPLAHIETWLDFDAWRRGKQSLWKVKLTGQIKRDGGNKVAGQHIEMLEEITYNSKAGKQLRADIKQAKHEEREREKARHAKWVIKNKAKRAEKLQRHREREKQRRINQKKRLVTQLERRLKSITKSLAAAKRRAQ